jgi:DNA-binding LacI/PurR family transcriptional regulator/signal transduction histidine kinase/ActR/RegA family two-component response regulator
LVVSTPEVLANPLALVCRCLGAFKYRRRAVMIYPGGAVREQLETSRRAPKGRQRGADSVRRTIALLVDYIDHLSRGYGLELREAFEAACSARDVNLVWVAGRPFNALDPSVRAQNTVYDMVGARSVDGMILATAGLAALTGVSAVETFARRLSGIPVCSFGVELSGIASVAADERSAMGALVEHMLCAHGASQIVFLGGPVANPDAELRLKVFQDVLSSYGKTIAPRLLKHTDFTLHEGRSAIEELLRSGAAFDTVIAANDALAVGAAEALRAHSLRVPLNVRVTGFDDLLMSRLHDPPLSTVRLPLRAMAALAVDGVLAQLRGEPVVSCTTVACEFLARESCGCGNPSRLSLPPRSVSRRSADFVSENAERLLRLLTSTQRIPAGPRYATEMLAALEAELCSERLAFVTRLEALLANAHGQAEIFEDFQRAVSLLRDELRVVQDPELEELWHEARLQIALVATRSHAAETRALEERCDNLLKTGERLTTNLGDASLKAVLLRELAIVRIQNAFVSLSKGTGGEMLEPFFQLSRGQLAELSTFPYPANQLFPPGILNATERRTWAVFPLTFEADCLGVVGFECAENVAGYLLFRDRISSALKTAEMHLEIVQQAAIEERHNQERLAAGERLKSLSVLAGGIAHDLNNALGPLAALPDVILQELRESPQGFYEGSEVEMDLIDIKSAALRAAETIKDLLTLGRQHQVSKECVDLTQIATSCAASISVSKPQRGAKGALRKAEVVSLLAAEPLFVHGSEPHLARAIANLMRNALEASDTPKPICLRTFSVQLAEPLSGYELIEPGRYAVVSVSDSGRGISRSAMQRIFEPFFSGKKLSDHSGSGLGLAIVHGVVKEHAGFIDVESALGCGTVFTLYFPEVARTPRSSHPQPLPLERGRGKLLVVDDDPMQLRTAQRVLTRAGYEVQTAATGQRALDLFTSGLPSAHGPFDLVVLDMMLNDDEDGLEVFERICRLFPQQPGILVSGHAPLARGALALSRGMAWLSKPYTAEALLQAVQSALRADSSRNIAQEP